MDRSDQVGVKLQSYLFLLNDLDFCFLSFKKEERK